VPHQWRQPSRSGDEDDNFEVELLSVSYGDEDDTPSHMAKGHVKVL
jgi:exocyst complex component 2